DGIRDDLVTGVQKCALPICRRVCADDRHDRAAADWRWAGCANPWEVSMAIIELNAVSKAYQDKTVLHDFSLVVEPGQRVVILGRSEERRVGEGGVTWLHEGV